MNELLLLRDHAFGACKFRTVTRQVISLYHYHKECAWSSFFYLSAVQ